MLSPFPLNTYLRKKKELLWLVTNFRPQLYGEMLFQEPETTIPPKRTTLPSVYDKKLARLTEVKLILFKGT